MSSPFPAQPLTPTASLAYESEIVLYSAEFQQIFQIQNHGLILGARYQSARFNDSDLIGQPAPFTIGNATVTQPTLFVTAPISQQFRSDFDRVDGYAYYNWRIWDPLLVTAGVSYDYVHFPANHRASLSHLQRWTIVIRASDFHLQRLDSSGRPSRTPPFAPPIRVRWAA